MQELARTAISFNGSGDAFITYGSTGYIDFWLREVKNYGLSATKIQGSDGEDEEEMMPQLLRTRKVASSWSPECICWSGDGNEVMVVAML